MEYNVPVRLSNNASIPTYQTPGSSGADICASIDVPIVIKPLQRALIPTGLFFQIPMGYEIQIRPRSGLAYKFGITVLNSPGTIDSDYRGEIGVVLINLGSEDFTVHDGDRIAQAILAPTFKANFTLVDELTETHRGSGGYGSTGLQ